MHFFWAVLFEHLFFIAKRWHFFSDALSAHAAAAAAAPTEQTPHESAHFFLRFLDFSQRVSALGLHLFGRLSSHPEAATAPTSAISSIAAARIVARRGAHFWGRRVPRAPWWSPRGARWGLRCLGILERSPRGLRIYEGRRAPPALHTTADA